MKQQLSIVERHIGTLRSDRLAMDWRERDCITILDLRGSLLSGPSHESFDGLVDIMASGRKKVVLNLGALRKIDSRGIGSIINAAVKLDRHIAVVAISKHLNSLLAICKLSAVLPQFESEEEAIEMLAAI